MLEMARREIHAELEAYFRELDRSGECRGTLSGRGARRHSATSARKYILRPVKIAIVGDINSGKTTLTNLIVGTHILPKAVVNNTMAAVTLRYCDQSYIRRFGGPNAFETGDITLLNSLASQSSAYFEVFLPIPVLSFVELLDTPDIERFLVRGDEAAHLLSNCELVIWCSVATRIWTASERSLWTKLPDRLKNTCLFAFTNADKLDSQSIEAISNRVKYDPILSEKRFSFIDAVTASSARNYRGQIVDKDDWNRSGGSQFFKNLSELLKTVFAKRKSKVEDKYSSLSHKGRRDLDQSEYDALAERWADLEVLFPDLQLADVTTGHVEAFDSAIVTFKYEYCQPVLARCSWAEDDISRFLDLIPSSLAEISESCSRSPETRLNEIHAQISDEISDLTKNNCP